MKTENQYTRYWYQRANNERNTKYKLALKMLKRYTAVYYWADYALHNETNTNDNKAFGMLLRLRTYALNMRSIALRSLYKYTL